MRLRLWECVERVLWRLRLHRLSRWAQRRGNRVWARQTKRELDARKKKRG